ncbi:MAG: helix-turn-helix domain-containing protein [Gemmatimonadota bacterium]
MTRRSMYRHMAAAGLQPRDIVNCAYVVRAYSLLRMQGGRMKHVSARLGFADPQTLSDLVREWTGVTPRLVCDSLRQEEFVGIMVTKLLRSTAAAEGLVLAH